LRHQLADRPDAFEAVIGLREQIGPFLDACVDRFRVADFSVVGFTSTFEQNLASLALAYVIKARVPPKAIVVGRAHREGVLGLEMHRRFPWVDFVCSGECDDTFPQLVKHIAADATIDRLPGLIHRRHGTSMLGAPADRVHDMDRLPDPDYADYFDALR